MDKNLVLKNNEHNKSSSKPKCISAATWERFQSLQKRTDEVTKRSTEKRIKHLQKKILQNVEDKLTSEEDQTLLREHGVILNKRSTGNEVVSAAETSNMEQSSNVSAVKFKEVEQYLGINDHLRYGSSISGAPNSGLEEQIEVAISSGDVTTAEELSDRLATRDYGVKVAQAFAARDYMKRKKKEEEMETFKKKKKLNWGFEHKQRWETKSNM